MSNLVVNWSERDLAQELSRTLRGGSSGSGTTEPRDDDYVQFSAARFWAGDVVEARPAPSPQRIEINAEGFSEWEALLGWCLDVSQAKTIFVMDSQGFLIDTQGSWSYEDVEAVGTQLMVTLEQADRMELGGRRALHVAARFEAFDIVGVRVPPGSKDAITLGMVSSEPFNPDVIAALAEQAALSLPRL
jgi:hypothetical protein